MAYFRVTSSISKPFLSYTDSSISPVGKEHSCRQLVSGVLSRWLSQHSNADEAEKVVATDLTKKEERLPSSVKTKLNEPGNYDPVLVKDGSDDEELNSWKWKLELAWLSKALEPAMQLYKWASSTGSLEKQKIPPSTHSFSEILTNLQWSKVSIQDWSLSDLTVGLYLIFFSQASAGKVEDFKGIQIFSDAIVQELIYHLDLAKGAYRGNATGLACHSMLREKNILKFVKDSSVMRPGYYIGIDTRNKLVILGIRGTHTVYDLITDAISSSDQKVSFEGFSTHFGTAEAARWYLDHEMQTIKKCLEKHKDYRVRLVGHSLGGAAAALLAIMIRKKSAEELGFSPEIVSAVGFGTPPCASKELAESCATYVSTVVLQDDIIPRLSAASLARLRNEILETDWMSVFKKEDWKGIVDLVTNAKQVMSSVQDVAQKLADYAKFRCKSKTSYISVSKDGWPLPKSHAESQAIARHDGVVPEELFTPGTLFYLKRKTDDIGGNMKSRESYTLWKRHPGEHFQRILLLGNFISDHKCESHYYALRDVLKGLPVSDENAHFKIW